MKTIQTKSFNLAVYSRGDPNAEKLALILPGRLDTKDYIHMTSHTDFLAGLGFYAVSFDPPFSWESPGDIANYNTTNYIEAVNELIEHFGNRPTLLIGHSRGGAVVILAGASNQSVVAIVPIMATYGAPTSPSDEDLKVGAHISYKDLPPGDKKTEEQKKFVLPFSYFEDGQKYNPAETLKRFVGPKLLVYGAQDTFTTPERVKEVFEALTEPKMLLELECDHDYRYYPEMIKEVNRALEVFLVQQKIVS